MPIMVNPQLILQYYREVLNAKIPLFTQYYNNQQLSRLIKVEKI